MMTLTISSSPVRLSHGVSVPLLTRPRSRLHLLSPRTLLWFWPLFVLMLQFLSNITLLKRKTVRVLRLSRWGTCNDSSVSLSERKRLFRNPRTFSDTNDPKESVSLKRSSVVPVPVLLYTDDPEPPSPRPRFPPNLNNECSFLIRKTLLLIPSPWKHRSPTSCLRSSSSVPSIEGANIKALCLLKWEERTSQWERMWKVENKITTRRMLVIIW